MSKSISTTILRKFSKGREEPKEGEPILRKYSKRLRGASSYQYLYLEKF
jgi:hypothetical protein